MNNTTLMSMYLALTITFILPLVGCLILFLKKRLTGWPFFVGFGLCMITQLIISPTLAIGASYLNLSQVTYILFAGILGAVLEEFFHYIALKSFKHNKKVKDAVSLGLGQAITITIGVGVVLISYVMAAKAIQDGSIFSMYDSMESAMEIMDLLNSTPWYYYIFTALDCVLNVTLYIMYSIMIMFAIRTGERRHLINTMIIHASITSMGSLLATVSVMFQEVYTIICVALVIYIALPMIREMLATDKETSAQEKALAEKLVLENSEE